MSALTNTELHLKIQDHLASGGVIVLRTTYRYTEYTHKHAQLFRVASDAHGSGVWIGRSKAAVFVFPQYLRFGRYVTA